MSNSNVIQLFKSNASSSVIIDGARQVAQPPVNGRGILANYFMYPDSNDMIFFIADRSHKHNGFYRVPMKTFYNSRISPGDLTQHWPIDFVTSAQYGGERVELPNGTSCVLRGAICRFGDSKNEFALYPKV